MFYVLNFSDHKFASCDSCADVNDEIRRICVDNGRPEDEVEVIAAFADGVRFSVDEYRNAERTQSW